MIPSVIQSRLASGLACKKSVYFRGQYCNSNTIVPFDFGTKYRFVGYNNIYLDEGHFQEIGRYNAIERIARWIFGETIDVQIQ